MDVFFVKLNFSNVFLLIVEEDEEEEVERIFVEVLMVYLIF